MNLKDKKVPFESLGKKQPEGIVHMSELFDIAFKDVYGDIETASYVTCELHDDTTWVFSVDINDNETVCLRVSNDYNIGFWNGNTPLHINQAPIYLQLFRWGYIQ